MLKYSAKYFDRTAKIISKHRQGSVVTLQFFQRKDNAMLSGMNEVLDILRSKTEFTKYKIKHAEDGDIINAGDVVLELEGFYPLFGEYEGIIDGVLSRATSLATNAMEVIKAAKGKKVIYMGDRADHYLNQELDGYSIALGGIETQVTDAQITYHNGAAVGTMPHALIQMFNGDLNAALRAYKDTFPGEKLSALIDFNNDILSDALKAYKEFGDDLGSVRVDTGANMSDAMFMNDEEYGVTPTMIKTLRNVLDKVGGNKVQIIVSSGFTAKKIEEFEKQNTPVDVYGVGGSLVKINHGFTCDAVRIDGKDVAKVGRGYRENALKWE